jgi:hypothetical protein
MNKKNSFVRKVAVVCLAVAISACEPFDPTNSADLTAHWSADSLVLRDGDDVSIWPDSSLNGHDAMATASSRPTYRIVDGVPMVHFDGIDDYMTSGTATDWRFLRDGREWTVFVVFRSVAGEPGGKHVLLDIAGADFANTGFAISYDARPNARRSEAVRLSVEDTTGPFPGAFALDMATGNRGFPPGKWGIISASFKAPSDGYRGEATLFVNGYRRVVTHTPLLRSRSRAATELNIGRHGLRNEFLTQGDIKEIVIYRRALTDDEHYQAIRRLAGKVSPAVRIRTPLSRNWLSHSTEKYQAFGIAFRIPSTGKLVAIQRQGIAHLGGPIGEVRQWESNDRGATWTNRLTYDSQYDDRNVGGGLALKTGSILAFIARYDGVHWIDMRALRSVDDAQTFSDIGAPLPTNGCSAFSPYGPMVELPSGRLLQTFYGDVGTTYKAWVSESVDDGLTWAHKADIYSGALRVNETSLTWISGSDDATSTLVAVSRNDGGYGLLQFVSRDGGSTWTSQGLIPGGVGTDVSPWLHRLSDGTLVNAWHERSWFTFRIRMALADEVAASPSNWGPPQVTYQAVTQVVGDSGYPALLSATGWDDDLIQIIYDRAPSGKANLLITPISLP